MHVAKKGWRADAYAKQVYCISTSTEDTVKLRSIAPPSTDRVPADCTPEECVPFLGHASGGSCVRRLYIRPLGLSMYFFIGCFASVAPLRERVNFVLFSKSALQVCLPSAPPVGIPSTVVGFANACVLPVTRPRIHKDVVLRVSENMRILS